MKLLLIFSLLLFAHYTKEQNSSGAIKWKSAKGIEYNYTGELRDGKPHGVGYATAKDGMEKIFGYFKNGMQSGKAVSWSYGYSTIAEYNEKDGLAYGPGANCSNSRNIIAGEFNRGEFTGKLVSLSTGEIRVLSKGEDYLNGKIIKISAFGNYITDAYYVNGDLNGPGYYLDVIKNERTYGTWRNDELIGNYSGYYPTFLRNNNLRALNHEDYIIVYSDKSADNKIRDTCFVYDKKKEEKSFGYFENNMLRSGLFTVEDKISIIGNWDEAGLKNGYCVLHDDAKRLFIAGNFKKDKMDGDVSFYNKKDDIIYIGETSEGEMTGEGILFKNNEIHSGSFKKGLLEGKGKIIYPNCTVISAGFTGGDPVLPYEIILPGEKKLNTKPKDVCTAINFLLSEFDNNFKNITSTKKFDIENKEENPFFDEYRALETPYRFPGAVVNKIVEAYKQNNYNIGLAVSDDYAVIKKKYDAFCAQLKACNITSLEPGKTLKLSGTAKALKPGEETTTTFYIPLYGNKTRTPKIIILIEGSQTFQLTAHINAYQEIE